MKRREPRRHAIVEVMRIFILTIPLFAACASSAEAPAVVPEPKTKGVVAGKEVPELLDAVVSESSSSAATTTNPWRDFFQIFVGSEGLRPDFCSYQLSDPGKATQKARFVIEVRSNAQTFNGVVPPTHYDICPTLHTDTDCVKMTWRSENRDEFVAQTGGAVIERKSDGTIEGSFGAQSNTGHVEGRFGASRCPKPSAEAGK